MSNPEADIASTAEAEKRQPRQARLVKASLGCERLGRFDVTIRNVSKTGVGGKAPHMMQIGERVTLYMPGHQPMIGTVRWVADTRFGLETDHPIETGRLRGAHGDELVTTDSKADFQIVPAPKLSTWRPGLGISAPLPGHYGRHRQG